MKKQLDEIMDELDTTILELDVLRVNNDDWAFTNRPDVFEIGIDKFNAVTYLCLMDEVKLIATRFPNIKTIHLGNNHGELLWEDPDTGEMVDQDPDDDFSEDVRNIVVFRDHLYWETIDTDTGVMYNTECLGRKQLEELL